MSELEDVEYWGEQLTIAKAEYKRAILSAHSAGHSLRTIAAAAGTCHQYIDEVVRKSRAALR